MNIPWDRKGTCIAKQFSLLFYYVFQLSFTLHMNDACYSLFQERTLQVCFMIQCCQYDEGCDTVRIKPRCSMSCLRLLMSLFRNSLKVKSITCSSQNKLNCVIHCSRLKTKLEHLTLQDYKLKINVCSCWNRAYDKVSRCLELQCRHNCSYEQGVEVQKWLWIP